MRLLLTLPIVLLRILPLHAWTEPDGFMRCSRLSSSPVRPATR
jgi:hypothetical protein